MTTNFSEETYLILKQYDQKDIAVIKCPPGYQSIDKQLSKALTDEYSPDEISHITDKVITLKKSNVYTFIATLDNKDQFFTLSQTWLY